jgi:hypothetical protein
MPPAMHMSRKPNEWLMLSWAILRRSAQLDYPLSLLTVHTSSHPQRQARPIPICKRLQIKEDSPA